MPIAQLTWEDLEAIIDVNITNLYNHLANDFERREFCHSLRNAENANQPRECNVPYSNPYMGVSYALKYHMQRADNIAVALHQVYTQWQRPQFTSTLSVLDIGAGTGSGVMGLSFYLSQMLSASPEKVCFVCSEPSDAMRKIGELLLKDFFPCLEYALHEPINPFPFSHTYPLNQFRTFQAFADFNEELSEEKKFDLILFSYTFDIQVPQSQQWLINRDRVVSLIDKFLRNTGVALFLTPDAINLSRMMRLKQMFVQDVLNKLIEDGQMMPLCLEGDCKYEAGGNSFSPERHPPLILKLRDKLNDECRRLKIPTIFGETPDVGDFGQPRCHIDPNRVKYREDPYYGVWYRLDAVTPI